jgi:hypothetical protein
MRLISYKIFRYLAMENCRCIKIKDFPAERQCVLAELLQVFDTVYEFEEYVIMACCDVKFQLLTTMLLIES